MTVEKAGKELQNCEILKTDAARVSEPIPFLFGKKASELLGAFEDIKKIVGYINVSVKLSQTFELTLHQS